jgi:rubrerythrin
MAAYTLDAEPAAIADLNDLLKLDYDALPVYTLAIAAVRDREAKAALRAFRADHERHVRDLAALIRDLGGLPIRLPHLPTGLLKLGVQALAAPGGDRIVLLAFKSNERQSRDKYARLAEALGGTAPEAAALVRRNAEDEVRHYDWVNQTLETLGVGHGTAVGAAAGLFARFHGMNADVIESVERVGLVTIERLRRQAFP